LKLKPIGFLDGLDVVVREKDELGITSVFRVTKKKEWSLTAKEKAGQTAGFGKGQKLRDYFCTW